VSHPRRWSIVCAAVLFLGLALTACGPSSPAEKTAQKRSLYKARLNGFVVEEEPIIEAPIGEIDAPAEEEADFEPVAISQRVLLDILIQHDSNEKLPGVTVDISMAAADGQEKDHWRVWFDTSDIEKANVTQFTHILEDVSYEEGDGFFVEVRQAIPEEERSEYKEFAAGS